MRPDNQANSPKRSIHQGIAGFTLLAFLLTQLAWPLPVSAQDMLRTEQTSQAAGLEELTKELQEKKGPSTKGFSFPPLTDYSARAMAGQPPTPQSEEDLPESEEDSGEEPPARSLEEYLAGLKQTQTVFSPEEHGEFPTSYETVQAILKPLLETIGLNPLAYPLFLVDDPEPNAWVFPEWKTIFVTTGLLRFAAEERLSEDALAFILAHEVRHLRQFEEDAQRREKPKVLERMAQRFTDEYDADAGALRLLDAAGYSIQDAESGFGRLRQHLSPGERSSFGTHPQLLNRMDNIRRTRENRRWGPSALKPPRPLPQQFLKEAQRLSSRREGWKRATQVETAEQLAGLLSEAHSLSDLHFSLWAGLRQLHTQGKLLQPVVPEAISAALKKRLEELLIWPAGLSKQALSSAALSLARFLEMTVLVDFGLLQDEPEKPEKERIPPKKKKVRAAEEKLLEMLFGTRPKEEEAQPPKPGLPTADWKTALQFQEEKEGALEVLLALIQIDLPAQPLHLGPELKEEAVRKGYVDYLERWEQLGRWGSSLEDVDKYMEEVQSGRAIPPFVLRWESILGRAVFRQAATLTPEWLLRLFQAAAHRRWRGNDIARTPSNSLDQWLYPCCINYPALLEAMDPPTLQRFLEVERGVHEGTLIFQYGEMEEVVEQFAKIVVQVSGQSPEKQEILRKEVKEAGFPTRSPFLELALRQFPEGWLLGQPPMEKGFQGAQARLRQLIEFLESEGAQEAVSEGAGAVRRLLEVYGPGLSQVEQLTLLVGFAQSSWYLAQMVKGAIVSSSRIPRIAEALKPLMERPTEELKAFVDQTLQEKLGEGPWKGLSFWERFLCFCYTTGLFRLPTDWEFLDHLVRAWSLEQIRLFKELVDKASQDPWLESEVGGFLVEHIISFRASREELSLRLGLLGLLKELDVSPEAYLPPARLEEAEDTSLSGATSFVGELGELRGFYPSIVGFPTGGKEFEVFLKRMGILRPRWATRLNINEEGEPGFRNLLDYLKGRQESPERLTELVRSWLPPTSYRNWVLYRIFIEHFLGRQPDLQIDTTSLADPGRLAEAWEKLPPGVKEQAKRFLREQIFPWLIHDDRLDFINRLVVSDLIQQDQKKPVLFDTDRYAEEASGYQDARFSSAGGPNTHLDLVVGRLLASELKERVDDPSATPEALLTECLLCYPRPSPERDEWLSRIAGHPSATVENWETIISLVRDPALQERLSLRALRTVRQADGPVTLTNHIQLITRWLSKPTPARDALLRQIIQEQVGTVGELSEVESLLLPPPEEERATGRQAVALAGHDLLQTVIGYSSALERVDLLGWLFLGEEKPDRLRRYEFHLHLSFDGLKQELAEVGEQEVAVAQELRVRLLTPLLDGEGGILNDEQATQLLFRKLFDRGLPSREGFGGVIRVIAESLVDQSGRLHRRELFFHLFATPELFIGVPASPAHTQARMTRLILESYGLVGVKVGQVLSNSASVLGIPASLQAELERLQDEAPPMEKGIALRYLNQVYQGRFHERFPRLGKLLGSASVSVVYEVVLPDGQRGALKLLRPMARHRIAEDLDLLRRVKEDTLTRLKAQGIPLSDWMPSYLEQLIHRAERLIIPELDLTSEAQNIRELQEGLARRGSPIKIPQVLDNPAADVLVTELVEGGIRLTADDLLKAQGLNPRSLRARVAQELVRQIREGLYHGDPHPGNFLVEPSGQLWMLDLGAVYKLSPEQGQFLLDLIQSVALKGDVRTQVEAFLKGKATPFLLEEVERTAAKDIPVRDRVMQVLLSIDRYGQLPEELALSQRVFLQGNYLFEGLRLWDLAKIAWQLHHSGLEEVGDGGVRQAREELGRFSGRHRETFGILWGSRRPGEVISPTDYFKKLPVLMRRAGFREGKLWWIPKGPVVPEALQETPRLKVFIQPEWQDAIRAQLKFSENLWMKEADNLAVKGALLIGDAGFRKGVESQLASLEQSFLQIGPQSVGQVNADLLAQLLTHNLLRAGRIFHAGLEEFIGEGFQVEEGTAIAA